MGHEVEALLKMTCSMKRARGFTREAVPLCGRVRGCPPSGGRASRDPESEGAAGVNPRGFTIVELAVTTLIVAIIGLTMAGSIIFFVQLFMYSYRQLDTQKIAQELMDTMIEGTPDIRGIRYARTVIDASSTQFTYTYGYPTPADQLSVRFRLQRDGRVYHVYRRTRPGTGGTWSTAALVPYYVTSGVTVIGRSSPQVIFTYRQAGDVPWTGGSTSLIRRVIINIRVQTGSGAFNAWQGSFDLASSVEIKGFG